jgi:hypothetical protein
MKQLYSTVCSIVSQYFIRDYEVSYDAVGNQVRKDYKYPQNFVDIYMPLFKKFMVEKYAQYARPNHYQYQTGFDIDVQKIENMKYPTEWVGINMFQYWKHQHMIGGVSLGHHDVHQFVMLNIGNFPLDVIFPDDIVKIGEKFYKIPKPYKYSEFSDFETNYNGVGDVSVWRESLTTDIAHDAFVLVTNDVEYDIKAVLKHNSFVGEFYDEDGMEYSEYETLYENEYLFKGLVEINVEKTLELNKHFAVEQDKTIFGAYHRSYAPSLESWGFKTQYREFDYKLVCENPYKHEQVVVPEFAELSKAFETKIY